MPLDVVKSHAADWVSLAAWRGALTAHATIAVVPRPARYTRRLGTAWTCEQRAVVYATGDLITDLPTVLHELAHLAAPTRVHHDRPWRVLYLDAVAEATRTPRELLDADVALDDLRAQAEAAIRAWLDATGQLTVLRALGILQGDRR